jgi:hypothetical protein
MFALALLISSLNAIVDTALNRPVPSRMTIPKTQYQQKPDFLHSLLLNLPKDLPISI